MTHAAELLIDSVVIENLKMTLGGNCAAFEVNGGYR
jgi:hypothetical protein